MFTPATLSHPSYPVHINGRKVPMELDTGASVSVMSESTWKKNPLNSGSNQKRTTKDLQWRKFKRHGSTSSQRRVQQSTLQVTDPGNWINLREMDQCYWAEIG